MPLRDPDWTTATPSWKLIDASPDLYQIAIFENVEWVARPPAGEVNHHKRYCVWGWHLANKLYQSNFLPACRVFVAGFIAGFDSWEKQLLEGEPGLGQ